MGAILAGCSANADVGEGVGACQEALSWFECERGNAFSAGKLLQLLGVLGYQMPVTPRTCRSTL